MLLFVRLNEIRANTQTAVGTGMGEGISRGHKEVIGSVLMNP